MHILLAVLCALAHTASADPSFGMYFADWAHYRAAPYTHTAADVEPIAPLLNTVMYSFVYFCPPAGTSPMPYWAIPPYGSCTDATEFELTSVDPKDASYIPQFVGYKANNPNFKVTLSIGGWNFPSEFFSKMVATPASRAKFIASVHSWISKYQVDGVDLDWEYPGSPSRTDNIKITCDKFQTVHDAGGSSADTANLPLLLRDLRSALGPDKTITVASQADATKAAAMNLTACEPYVTSFHLMTYDYFVSDIKSSPSTGANAPLYNPSKTDFSIDATVKYYKSLGIPTSKLSLGIAYYGHTWYTPGATGTAWQQYGAPAQVQGKCCGPFKQTYGAAPGAGAKLCGTLMLSEIAAAGPTTYFDTGTQTNMGFVSSSSTFITYSGTEAIKAIVKYALDNDLAGVFAYDSSMDSVSSSGQFTFDYTHQIYSELTGKPVPNPCTPSSSGSCGESVCAACCSTSITSASACSTCVSSHCGPPPNSCTGKQGGYYCSGKTTYISCPEGITQSCAPGTCCQQSSPGIIACGFCN